MKEGPYFPQKFSKTKSNQVTFLNNGGETDSDNENKITLKIFPNMMVKEREGEHEF